ncbi:hypothetical protein PoB_005026700 [Plakobranchus ocellatus]|uniref:Uncharacterized protein n=1 Tax=Plakobranchus ocellatus TaxID=259542 RepID=A0AAV4BXF4_9GAST|nr:hypothetical protein PoB_005026700 [Plakobranchus ocellatus]
MDLKRQPIVYLRRSSLADYHTFFYDDQPEKRYTLVSVGRSSAFLLLATESAPRAASVQGFFASSGHEKKSGFLFSKVMINFLKFGSRTRRPLRTSTKGTHCAEFQSCAKATLELYSQQGVWGGGDFYWDLPKLCLKKTDQPIGQRGSALLSRLGRRQRLRKHVDEWQPLLPGRHHLKLQDPPNKAPTLYGSASHLFLALEGSGG